MGAVLLKLGVLSLRAWSPSFNFAFEKTTNAQVWVRFYGLNWAFWHPQILSDLTRGIRVPFHIDDSTLAREVGLFARLLINPDFSAYLIVLLFV